MTDNWYDNKALLEKIDTLDSRGYLHGYKVDIYGVI